MTTALPASASFASSVHKMVCDFLAGKYRPDHTQRGHSLLALPAPCALLRLACLGNPEKTIQGELLGYLRMRGLDAVSEVGLIHGKGRRSIDIVVFDATHRASVAIELKHYSANQGSVATLLRGMKSDSDKQRLCGAPNEPLPVVHVGLYTDVTSIDPSPSHRSYIGAFRFLRVYYTGQPHRSAATEMDGVNSKIVSKFPNAPTQTCIPPSSSFTAHDFPEQGATATVTGTVASIVILSQ